MLLLFIVCNCNRNCNFVKLIEIVVDYLNGNCNGNANWLLERASNCNHN